MTFLLSLSVGVRLCLFYRISRTSVPFVRYRRTTVQSAELIDLLPPPTPRLLWSGPETGGLGRQV
ncbi:hypothetical protein ASG12_07715 [Williamsia sp. Leaf354]|nr:hypothetical protein ASG12_07715 [Williamsia sp. Leaf354]